MAKIILTLFMVLIGSTILSQSFCDDQKKNIKFTIRSSCIVDYALPGKYKITHGDIKKIKKSISIQSKNGRKIIFTDVSKYTDDVDQKYYEYIGVISLINTHVVKLTGYESGNYILVNSISGSVIYLWGLPYVSPDGKIIASYAANIDFESQPNGIQLIEIHNNRFVCLGVYKPDLWEPRGLAWRDCKSLYVKQYIPDYLSSTKKNRIAHALMTISINEIR